MVKAKRIIDRWGNARQILFDNGKIVQNRKWSPRLTNARAEDEYISRKVAPPTRKEKEKKIREEYYEPKERLYKVHIRMKYEKRKDSTKNIDYEASITVRAENQYDAERQAISEYENFLDSGGFPRMKKYRAVISASETDDVDGYFNVRDRKRGVQTGLGQWSQ